MRKRNPAENGEKQTGDECIYYIVDNQKRFEENNLNKLLECCLPYEYFEQEYQDSFDEYLDEEYRSVEMFGITFLASEILRELRPNRYDIEYNQYLNDEIEFEYENAATEIGMMKPGDTVCLGYCEVKCFEDEQDEADPSDAENIREYVSAHTKPEEPAGQSIWDLAGLF